MSELWPVGLFFFFFQEIIDEHILQANVCMQLSIVVIETFSNV